MIPTCPRRLIIAAIMLMLAAISPRPALAQSCSFSATDLDFGVVDVLGASATDAVGSVSVNCTQFLGVLTSIDMRIHLGEGSGGTGAGLRRMTSPSGPTPLGFQLYRDAGHTAVWGGIYGGPPGDPLHLTGGALLTLLTTTTANFPVYGRVPGGQSATVPGSYESSFFRDPLDVRVNYRTCALIVLCIDRTGSFSFQVQGQVLPDCRVVAGDLDFGTHGLLDHPVDATSQIEVTCTAGTSHHVGLGYGLAGSAIDERRMRDLSGNSIGYQLYRDAARSLAWGQQSDGAAEMVVGSGDTQALTVHGRVPAQHAPPPGSYSDTVVVTITY